MSLTAAMFLPLEGSHVVDGRNLARSLLCVSWIAPQRGSAPLHSTAVHEDSHSPAMQTGLYIFTNMKNLKRPSFNFNVHFLEDL